MQKYILYINFRRLIRESISAFLATKALGYKVAVISANLPKELEVYVDTYLPCNTANLDELVNKINALKQQIDIAGVTCFTETAVESSSIVAKLLNLVGLPKDAIGSVRNKAILRKRTKHIDSLPVSTLANDKEIESFIKNVSLPVIIKPINTSGSTGIYLIKKASDLETFYASRDKIANPTYDPTLSNSKLEFVIEKYIEGQEVSVEGYVSNKMVTVVGITHKTTSDPFKLEVRHVFPAPMDNKIRQMIEKKTTEYVLALGLDNTSFHLEGKYNNNSFTLIEVAARPGGDYITSHLVPLAKGYDFYKNLVKVSLGEQPEVVNTTHEISGIQYILANKEGTLSGYSGMDKILDHPWVKHVIVEIPIGSDITLPPKDFRKQRLISVVSTAPTHELLNEHLDWVTNTISPVIG